MERNNIGIIQDRCMSMLDPFGLEKNLFFEKESEPKGFLFFIMRALRKLHIIKTIPYFLWFGTWKKQIKKRDNWILFFDDKMSYIARYIKKHNKKAKIFYYSWDIIYRISADDASFVDGAGTFDIDYARKDGILFYNQFFNNTHLLKSNNTTQHNSTQLNSTQLNSTQHTLYDFIFVGLDKGRAPLLNALKKEYEQKGFSFFLIITDKTYKGGLSYTDYLQKVEQSRCIVEILQEGQAGCSLRAMESIFYKKKLITNNKAITRLSFYKKENIFVLGIDSDIETFMKIPYSPLEANIIEEYSLNGFIDKVLKSAKQNTICK